jgi:ribose transport system substrate-binding protein
MTAGLLVAVLAACSNSDASPDSKGAGAPADTSADAVAVANTELTKLYAGTNKVPDGDPVPAQTAKKIFVISCGQQASGCSVPTAGAVAAGKELGWHVTTLDTALDFSKQGALVDQAVAAGAQGIIMVGNDCALSPASFQRAKDAHIPVVNLYGADCDEPYASGDPVGAHLWTEVPTADYTTNPSFFQGQAAAKAQYIIAKTNGKARVLSFGIVNSALITAQVRVFDDALAKCATCKVYDVPTKSLDFGPNLQRIAQQALLQHPDATVVAPINDSVYLGGIQAGLKAAGTKNLFVMGADGTPPGMELLKSGELTAELGWSADWYGWAAADTMNSLLAGKEPRNSGVGWQIIDKDHNMDLVGSDGAYQTSIDYRAAYRTLWGLS